MRHLPPIVPSGVGVGRVKKKIIIISASQRLPRSPTGSVQALISLFQLI